MNREILFRGKRLDNGEWVTGRLITDDRDGKEFIVSWIGYHCEEDIDSANRYIECFGFEVDPETVGQYTGLKDRNGVKIFEGDYIYHHWHKDTAYLVWHERYICLVGKPFEEDTSKTYHYQKPDELDLEVIGNIHDNPELLEV